MFFTAAFFVVLAKLQFFSFSFLRFLQQTLLFCIFVPQKKEAMGYRIENLGHPVRCRTCGEIIPFGRVDKKYCSVECKNRWHNRRNAPDPRPVIRRVIRILERNHSILDKLLRLGIGSLDRLTLLGLGFNPDYSTSYKKTGIHHQYTCYDIRYELTPGRIKKIVRTVLQEDDADTNPSGDANF